MGRLARWIAVLLVAFAVLGCRSAPDREALVVWTAFEGGELESLGGLITEYSANTGKRVILLKVPFDSLRQKVLVAGPALQGPDVLIGPHDWVGMLQTAELLAPIPENVLSGSHDDFYPIALQAGSFADRRYLAPMMMECVVLARNTDLCPTKPEDLEQLVEIALTCQEEHPGVGGFSYEVGNFYFTWAFLTGFGTDFLEPFADKELEMEKLKFDSPEAVAGVQWVADLRLKHKLVSAGVKNDLVVDLFLNNKLGMMLCGPWNLDAIRKAGVPYVLEPIPPGPEGPSSPFVGITGAMMSRYSEGKPGVEELLLFLTSPESSAKLCQSSGRPPTREKTAKLLAELVTDPTVERDMNLFSEAASVGTPLPNHPAIQPVWDTMKQALELITSGQVDAKTELERTTERVRAKIRFMME